MSSQRGRAFLALCEARAREFFRESEAVFWTFVFPVVLTLVLALAFRSRPLETHKLAVVKGPRSAALAAALGADGQLAAHEAEASRAAEELRLGKVALVVEAGDAGVEYRLDPSRP